MGRRGRTAGSLPDSSLRVISGSGVSAGRFTPASGASKWLTRWRLRPVLLTVQLRPHHEPRSAVAGLPPGATEARRERAFRFRREAGGERGFSLILLGQPFQMRPMPLAGRSDTGRWLDKAEEAKHGWPVILSLRMTGGNGRRVIGERERKNGKVSFRCLFPTHDAPRGFQFEIEQEGVFTTGGGFHARPHDRFQHRARRDEG
jgi:hypothetical protein